MRFGPVALGMVQPPISEPGRFVSIVLGWWPTMALTSGLMFSELFHRATNAGSSISTAIRLVIGSPGRHADPATCEGFRSAERTRSPISPRYRLVHRYGGRLASDLLSARQTVTSDRMPPRLFFPYDDQCYHMDGHYLILREFDESKIELLSL